MALIESVDKPRLSDVVLAMTVGSLFMYVGFGTIVPTLLALISFVFVIQWARAGGAMIFSLPWLRVQLNVHVLYPIIFLGLGSVTLFAVENYRSYEPRAKRTTTEQCFRFVNISDISIETKLPANPSPKKSRLRMTGIKSKLDNLSLHIDKKPQPFVPIPFHGCITSTVTVEFVNLGERVVRW